MRANTIVDLSKLYKSIPGGKHNKLIVLNEYLKNNSSAKIDINTTVLDYAKYYQFDQIFQMDYESRKKNSPHWETALSNWTDEIYTSFQGLYFENYTSQCDGIIYQIYNDVTTGIDKPLHKYVDYFTKAEYTTEEPYPEETDIIYHVLDGFSECLIDAVIYAHYYEKLNLELTELKQKGRISHIENNTTNDLKSKASKQVETIKPIHWCGERKRDIAYIFWQLKKLNLIECENLGLALSKVFFYDAKPIENTYFNAEFSKFEKGERPTNAMELDKILLQPKKVIIKSKKL